MTPRAAPSRCTWPRCREFATHRGRCDEHRPSGWTERPDPTKPRGSATAAGATQAEVDRWKRIVRQNNPDRICGSCGEPIAPADVEVDHVIPVAEGGALTDPNNGQLLHATPCHAIKTQTELTRARRRAAQARRARAAARRGET